MNDHSTDTANEKPHYFKYGCFWYCRMKFRSTMLFGTGLTREEAWLDYLWLAELVADQELQQKKEPFNERKNVTQQGCKRAE